ncbi:MAG TPA: HEAT repeat domain-containing protein [Pirellulales bacterium]|nr:HEAT repeat domain-containing protein [Pirellulales bacterium]
MQSVEQLGEQLGSGDQVKVYQAKRELAQRAAEAGTPGKQAARNELAAALAKAEAATKPRDAKDKAPVPAYSAGARGELARALSEVGGDMEVPALKQTLGDFDAREMARFALDRMTCQAATDALAEAATSAIGAEFRVGAINALGRRTGSGVTDALKKCAAESDPHVRLAAAEALAGHSDASADTLLVEAAKRHGHRAALRMSKARIRLAENLVRAGQKDAGKAIYQSIAKSDALKPQKRAAEQALAQLG